MRLAKHHFAVVNSIQRGEINIKHFKNEKRWLMLNIFRVIYLRLNFGAVQSQRYEPGMVEVPEL